MGAAASSSVADSVRPKMLKVRRTINISPARCFKTGATEASKSGFISRGGPVSKTTVHCLQ